MSELPAARGGAASGRLEDVDLALSNVSRDPPEAQRTLTDGLPVSVRAIARNFRLNCVSGPLTARTSSLTPT
jgi:hypothetical protein